MSDVKDAYNQIVDFLNSTDEKTLLISGIADEQKHRSLLQALNAQGTQRGLVYLIHTTIDGIQNFFHWAGLYKVKPPHKYGQAVKWLNLTIYFDKLSIKNCGDKYDHYAFDFIIIWPIERVTKNDDEIQMLKEMSARQKTKKIIYMTIKEPWYDPDGLKKIVDRTIRLDCENDDPDEYRRIMIAYNGSSKI